MPNPKLIQILRSRSDLTDDQIIGLSDDQAWDLIYEIDDREKAERAANRKPTVCFTGFNKADKAAMEDAATKVGLKPVQNVSMSLEYLVLGETPGQTKIAKAEEAEVKILHAHEFEQLFLGNTK
jgi:NAD-dependent DNA ligase